MKNQMRLMKNIATIVCAAILALSGMVVFSDVAYAREADMPYTRYTTATVNVRESGNTSSNIVRTLSCGSVVSVVEDQNGWSLLDDGTYICSDYLVSSKPVASYNWTTLETSAADYCRAWTGDLYCNIYDYYLASKYVKQGYMVNYITSDKGTNYYTIESATSVGKAVQRLQQGDVVNIDGVDIMIDGEIYGNYNYDDVIALWKRIDYANCIQTCIPPYGGPIVVKYGHVVLGDTN